MAFEKPTLDTVKVAIRTILSHDTNCDRKSATEWLENLKNSVYAWEICDQLLAAREGIEVSYLAAHMLRQKISRNFNELPLECYTSLRLSILNHLQSHDDYSVQGQLTMAIADLTLLLHDWRDPIEDLAKQLGLDSGLMAIQDGDYSTTLKALNDRLIFANIMHQMCDLNHNHSDRPCRIGAKRREEFEDYLITKCNLAINWWLSVLQEVETIKIRIANNVTQDFNDTGLKSKCLEVIDKLIGQIYLCYSAWLRIFDEENVMLSLPVVDSAFKDLKDPRTESDHTHKYAVEAVVSTAHFCEHNSSFDYLVEHLVKQIYTLEQAFKQSINSEDVEKSNNIARALTSVAETAFTNHVIDLKDFRIVNLMLDCLVHYDFEVVEETYTFWWLLLEQLQSRLKHTEYQPFIPYINKFVISVTKLCQFDPDEDSVISRDQDIHKFRANSAEIITNIMFITTVEDFMRDNNILQVLLTETSWEKVEAVLYLISCLIQMLTRDENNLRDQIFHCILRQQLKVQDLSIFATCEQLPLKIGVSNPEEIHPQVVATTLKIFGYFDNFLADYPDYLILAIKYILTAICDLKYRTKLMRYAAKSLASIMELNARRHLASYPQLLIIVKQLCSNLNEFDEVACTELLKCGAFIADAIPDPKIKDQFLCELITPIIKSLKNDPNQEDYDPTKHMDRLSSIFKQFHIHPSVLSELSNFISLIDTELWPVMLSVLAKGASEKGDAIERTCRALRYLIRCIKPEWMIERIADTMVNLYKSYPQNSSPLYICSILVDEFANKSPEINQGLFAMLEIFCTLTFTLLDMNASQSENLLTMKSYPETIDDMMRLFIRFMKKCPKEFLTCKGLGSIIDLCISSLRIDHPDANANVCKFITSFIKLVSIQDAAHTHIYQAIRNCIGARLVETVIRACLFDIPTNLISEEAPILYELFNLDRDLFQRWVEATVANLPKTNIQGIESVTSDQLMDFRNTITTAGSLKKIVNCLRATARLYT